MPHKKKTKEYAGEIILITKKNKEKIRVNYEILLRRY